MWRHKNGSISTKHAQIVDTKTSEKSCKIRQSPDRVLHHSVFRVVQLWISTHHVTSVHITPQTLNNFNFHCFTIIHSYPTLFTSIFISKSFNREHIFLILWSDGDTFNYNCVLEPKSSPWRSPDYWPKHFNENINKTYNKIEVHSLVVYMFYKPRDFISLQFYLQHEPYTPLHMRNHSRNLRKTTLCMPLSVLLVC
jgi:hypothetical protein